MEQIGLHEFYLLCSLLVLAILFTINHRYLLIRVKKNYIITKILNGQLILIFWILFLIFEIISPNSMLKGIFSVLKVGMICWFSYYIVTISVDFFNNKNNKKIQEFFLIITLVIFVSYVYCKYTEHNFYVVTAITHMLQIEFLSALVLIESKKRNCLKKTNDLLNGIIIYGYILLIYAVAFFDVIDVHIIFLFNLLSIYSIVLLVIITKSNHLDDLSVIFEGILKNAHYGIIVVDNQLKILTYNNYFFERFIHKDDADSFMELINKFKMITDNKLSIDNISTSVSESNYNHVIGEIVFNCNNSKVNLYYTINAIFDAKYKKIATMISFMDISQLKGLQKNIEIKNKQLIEANIKLKEHMENLSALISENERNKLMSEINDTIGHFMTEILGLLEVCSLLLQQNNNKQAEKSIIDTISRARSALNEIRQLVSQYKKGGYLND